MTNIESFDWNFKTDKKFLDETTKILLQGDEVVSVVSLN